MNQNRVQIRRSSAAAAMSGLLACGLALTGCGSASSDASTTSTVPASSTGAEMAGTAAMRALCDQMVGDALTADAATTLAEASSYAARVGTIDGVPQAVTMDYREDRFTFEVTGGVVTGCTYG